MSAPTMTIFHACRLRDEHARLTTAGITTDRGRCRSGRCPNKATRDVRINGTATVRTCAPHARVEIQLQDWGPR